MMQPESRASLISRMCSGLRAGSWLTPARLRAIALMLLIEVALLGIFVAVNAQGYLDAQGRPLGTDFANIYAAGDYLRHGDALSPYVPELQHAREQALLGENVPFYGWHYPPFFLAVAQALAVFPYGTALLVWLGVTLLLYLCAMRGILRPLAGGNVPLLLAAAYPAVFINIAHGHNGFLSAALMGGGLWLLNRRPWLAGGMLGLLVYKPQFGLMLPLVFLATKRWRAFVAASATVLALAGLVTLAYGMEVWQAFLGSLPFTREVILEQGATGWYKIQSLFSALRMWGGSIALAYGAQTLLTVGLAGWLVWLWRKDTAYPLQAAGLCVAAVLATPYVLDYDLMLLAPAIGFYTVDGMARGFRPWEKSALALVWLMPFVARVIAYATYIPFGWLVMGMFLLMIHIRAHMQEENDDRRHA